MIKFQRSWKGFKPPPHNFYVYKMHKFNVECWYLVGNVKKKCHIWTTLVQSRIMLNIVSKWEHWHFSVQTLLTHGWMLGYPEWD